MKLIYVLTHLLNLMLISPSVLSQGFVGSDPGKGTQMSAQPGGIVQEMPLSEPETIGNSYLNDVWLVGSIVLTDQKVIDDLPIRYDMKYNGLEIKTEKQVKFLSATRIDKFRYVGLDGELRRYDNPRQFVKVNPDIPNTFLELLISGEWNLYRQTYAVLVESNYNAALDMGTRDNKIVKKEHFVLSNEDQALIVEGSRRKFSKNFENKDEVFSFLKDNRLNLKDLSDIKLLVEFLNSN